MGRGAAQGRAAAEAVRPVRAEAQAYIGNDAERQGSYYYHEDEWAKFKAAALAYGA